MTAGSAHPRSSGTLMFGTAGIVTFEPVPGGRFVFPCLRCILWKSIAAPEG